MYSNPFYPLSTPAKPKPLAPSVKVGDVRWNSSGTISATVKAIEVKHGSTLVHYFQSSAKRDYTYGLSMFNDMYPFTTRPETPQEKNRKELQADCEALVPAIVKSVYGYYEGDSPADKFIVSATIDATIAAVKAGKL